MARPRAVQHALPRRRWLCIGTRVGAGNGDIRLKRKGKLIKRRALRVLFALALTAGAFVGSMVFGSAENGSVALDGYASYTAYVWDIEELPAGFRGTAVVRNAGSGPGMAPAITAVSNLVNYEVQYDGSSAFTLVRFIAP
jgi:hypothetical protein